MKNILIAGGTGLIGKKLVALLTENGHKVSVLSRSPKGPNEFLWNPKNTIIDETILSSVDVLINLSGAGIADKRWTKSRKIELHDSRIKTNQYLFSLTNKMPNLSQFICSSGINCYGYEDSVIIHKESDPYGNDYLSQLVKQWEESANLFKTKCNVVTVRTAVVLDSEGGALKKMISAIKIGLGSPLGSGKQDVAWIHITDLVRVFEHVIDKSLDGSYNAIADFTPNKEFNHKIAEILNKSFWAPNVPSFILKLILGEMSIILLEGVKASHDKLSSTGFEFKFKTIDVALKDVLKS